MPFNKLLQRFGEKTQLLAYRKNPVLPLKLMNMYLHQVAKAFGEMNLTKVPSYFQTLKKKI